MKLRSIYHPKSILSRSQSLYWALFQMYSNSTSSILSKSIGIHSLTKLLLDAGIVYENNSSKFKNKESTFSVALNSKLEKISPSKLELEVRKLKKRYNDKHKKVASNSKSDQVTLSLDLTYPQFCHLFTELVPILGNLDSSNIQDDIGLIENNLRSCLNNLNSALSKDIDASLETMKVYYFDD